MSVIPHGKQTNRSPDGKAEDVWALPNDEEFLCRLFTDLFGNYYDKLCWGPLLTGAAYELKAPGKPKKIESSDGGACACSMARMSRRSPCSFPTLM